MRKHRWYVSSPACTVRRPQRSSHKLLRSDVKLQLSPAYGDFLASLPPNPSTSALADKTTDKL
ncbi:MAG: hypothetical protein Q9183_004960, partial [Haloplaca sp. 2 TL-2023]